MLEVGLQKMSQKPEALDEAGNHDWAKGSEVSQRIQEELRKMLSKEMDLMINFNEQGLV